MCGPVRLTTIPFATAVQVLDAQTRSSHACTDMIGLKQISDVPMHLNSRGDEFFHLGDAVPMLESTYAQWEKEYDTQVVLSMVRVNWWLPVTLTVLYIVAAFGVQRIMKDRKPFDMRTALTLWNMFLSTFSFIGAARTVPHLLYNLYAFRFEETVCNPAPLMFGCGATGLWVQLFILSKIPELIDTAFIVLRKKKLIFLHWYHHFSVLLYCWHSYATESSTGLYFVAMNYSVHAIMYAYYGLAAARVLPKWFPAHLITIAQISQMFVGVAINVASFYYSKYTDVSCSVKDENLIAGGIMYGTYLYLFVAFAANRFLKPKKKAAAKKL